MMGRRRFEDETTAPCRGASVRRRARRLHILTLPLVSALVLGATACGGSGGGGVVTVLSDLQREEFRISVLTLNLRGIHDKWGGQADEETGATFIPWRDRYERVAAWMQATQITPDVITLQEVWGVKGCPLSSVIRNYDTLFELITRIRAHTGVEYRVANHIVRHVPQGLCSLLAGTALLYNPSRIRNTTPHPPGDNIWPHDTSAVVGVHLRESLPCRDTTEAFRNECGLIDGAGLAWQGAYHRTDGGRGFGPLTFTQLELERQRGRRFHVYTVHFNPDEPAASSSTKDMIAEMERRFGADRLYPPILAGDFNIGLGDMQNETGGAGPTFDQFEIAGYSGNDVMGLLTGDRDTFPSRFGLKVEQSTILPADQRDSSDRYCGGSIDLLWSDHCGILVRFVPTA